jgi:hypothetical protein
MESYSLSVFRCIKYECEPVLSDQTVDLFTNLCPKQNQFSKLNSLNKLRRLMSFKIIV